MPVVDKTNQTIQILPLPENKKLTSNTSIITGVANPTRDENYTPNGEYKVTASSFANDKTQPYNVFNDSESTFWQCDFSGNSNYNVHTNAHPKYMQDPYNKGTPSTYQGGGTTTNTWVTTIGEDGKQQSFIKGEWIQVQLPYNVYLFKYSILTPAYTESSTFPVKFTVVGSNDGKVWKFIDYRNTIVDEYPPIASHPLKTYNINSNDKYSFFRLIISEMSGKIPYVKLNQWNLWGVTINRQNTDAVSKVEAFVKDDNYSKIDGQRLNGDTYQLISWVENPTFEQCKKKCSDDNKCKAFSHLEGGSPERKMILCVGSESAQYEKFDPSKRNPDGITQSTVYIKKLAKETFVTLDRGIEPMRTVESFSNTVQSPTHIAAPEPAAKKCNIMKKDDIDILMYSNVLISMFAAGFFIYTISQRSV